MKKTILIIIGLNAIILTSLLSFNPSTVKAELVKSWDDEWLMCLVNGVPSTSYREHSCFQGSRYVSCVEQDCTTGIYDPID